MSIKLKIAVMLGGPSAEREVSLRSGTAVAKALRSLGHEVYEVDPLHGAFDLPPEMDVVLLALHGTYGEDGTVQRRLDELGEIYTGCDAEASRIAFDKVLTKQCCLKAGIPTAKYLVVNSAKTPWPQGWQPPLVVKPVRQGSSVGLQFVERVEDWPNALAEALKFDSEVLVEEKIAGRECTVGILAGEALPVVEVRPKVGSYDYRNKYTAGCTEYFCPASFDARDDPADSGCRARCVQGRGRARLRAGGRDGAGRRRTGGARGQHVAGHDGNEPAAEGGGGGGIELRAALPAHGGSGAGKKRKITRACGVNEFALLTFN